MNGMCRGEMAIMTDVDGTPEERHIPCHGRQLT